MTITLQAVNELIASLESAGELSIREQKFLKLAKAYQQLAAENVALKQAAEFATAPDMWVEQADGMLDYRYHEWYVDVLKAAMETPATDRIVAGIKADGVGEFIGRLQQHVDEGDFVGDEVAVIVGAIDCGKEFCEQLREGADK
ncbi:hypothetical protein LGM12_09390 [Klebsiella pneumoniae]|uniref:hypothetical protein n=1 Tax=Klebsiella pneumoniae TaxID=573 RepID=UPI001CFD163C|nr:hypothetical protein [Klebsiella pneumoniae]UDC35614.1 hypothetical protein LGM12_09390 [Klebsiella pneumoniae]